MSDLYGRVIEHLGTNYIGVADCDEMRQILKICLDEQEAELLLCIGHPPIVHGAKHLGRKAGLPTEQARALLDGLADRGMIARVAVLGRSLYSLLAILPGFYELTFMKPETYPADKERLRELWRRYKTKHLLPEIADYRTPPVRVVPVRSELPLQHRVYRHEDVERIIERAGTTAIGRCACREVSRRCDGPLEVCMLFDQIAEVLVQNGFARRASADECKQSLRLSEEAGLVHCAMNCTHSVQILCNCCGCCCMALRGVAELQRRGAVAVSAFAARVDDRLCTGCGDCREWCWADAITEHDDRSQVVTERCLGCGLCAGQCHARAIELVPRVPGPSRAPHNPVSLAARMAGERGRTTAIAKALAVELR